MKNDDYGVFLYKSRIQGINALYAELDVIPIGHLIGYGNRISYTNQRILNTIIEECKYNKGFDPCKPPPKNKEFFFWK